MLQIRADVSPEIVKNWSPSRCSRAASNARARSLPAVAWIGVPSAVWRGTGAAGGGDQAGHASSGVGYARRSTFTDSPHSATAAAQASSPIRLVRPYTSVASGGTDSSSVRFSRSP